MQFGFQKNKKTDDALKYITDSITDAIDKNTPCIIVTLHFPKAFDIVNHNLLSEKLHRMDTGCLSQRKIVKQISYNFFCTFAMFIQPVC